MPLDPEQPIAPLESATIRAAVKLIAVNVATVVFQLTGKTLDVAWINTAIDQGIPVLVCSINLYYASRAIIGRMNATQTIRKG